MSEQKKIALCLSGGGIRAMAFHAGLLKRLAEEGQLEDIKYISTVSGGSLLVGMIYSLNAHQWPSSSEYINSIAPKIEAALTKKWMGINALLRLIFNPCNWRYLLSRSNVIAQALESKWHVNGTTGNIPASPEWSINGTASESGKRFRIKNGEAGDYMLGYFNADEIPLSQAIAMSAGVPGVIGPLVIKTKGFKWYKRNFPNRSRKEITPEFKRLHVYDGGVYDNLGTEQFFDIGKQVLKSGYQDCVLVVSDAGSPFELSGSAGKLNPMRLLRINDIMMSQSRSLRVRSLMNYFIQEGQTGAYIRLGEQMKNLSNYFNLQGSLTSKYSEQNIKEAANYNTTLIHMSPENYSLLSGHGYELADVLIKGKRI